MSQPVDRGFYPWYACRNIRLSWSLWNSTKGRGPFGSCLPLTAARCWGASGCGAFYVSWATEDRWLGLDWWLIAVNPPFCLDRSRREKYTNCKRAVHYALPADLTRMFVTNTLLSCATDSFGFWSSQGCFFFGYACYCKAELLFKSTLLDSCSMPLGGASTGCSMNFLFSCSIISLWATFCFFSFFCGLMTM